MTFRMASSPAEIGALAAVPRRLWVSSPRGLSAHHIDLSHWNRFRSPARTSHLDRRLQASVGAPSAAFLSAGPMFEPASPSAAVSASGNGIFAARDNRAGSLIANSPSQGLGWPQTCPPIRAYSEALRKSPQTQDC